MTRNQRSRMIGDLGEELAKELLVEAGFTDIKDLNKPSRNHAHFDFEARRNGYLYLINVKARNRLQENGKLNPNFNFVKSKHQHIVLEKEGVRKAALAWIAIPID